MATERGREAAKSVGIWIRVSTEEQVQGESPEHHEKRARAYAEAKGWHVAEVYRLEAVSGKSVIEHPEAKRMLADIHAGAITGLVFSKLARLARNTKELLEFSEMFRAAGADLISLQEAIDTSSPAGRLFFTMIAAMAQWEREEIAERVQASVPIRAKLGKPIGGSAPFGYRWNEKRLEPDPDEAPVRALLHELYLEHRRRRTVARLLNERGHRTRNGSRFSDTTVERLLRDPTAKGLRRANYTRTDDRTKSWALKPENEWVYTSVEPIVSEELWESCNAILESQRVARKPVARKSNYLFAGFAYCACGSKMYVWTNSPKYVCTACRNKIPINDLEAVYREQLRHFLLSPGEIESHWKAADAEIIETENLVATTQSELRKLETEDDRLYQLYLSDGLSKEDFGRRHRPLSERRSQLEDELPRLQARLDVLRIGTASQAEAVEEARDLSARWDTLPLEDKRQIVEAITDRIVVGRDDVEIRLLHIPFGNDADKATRRCDRVAFLIPGVPARLTILKPEVSADRGNDLAARLRRRRKELGLFRKEAATRLGTCEEALMKWERGVCEPSVSFCPSIIVFLGYEPWDRPVTLREKLKATRRRRGLSVKRAATSLGVDEASFSHWETGRRDPKRASRIRIAQFLADA